MTQKPAFNINFLIDDVPTKKMFVNLLSRISPRIKIHHINRSSEGKLLGGEKPNLIITSNTNTEVIELLSQESTIVILSDLTSIKTRYYGDGRIIILSTFNALNQIEVMLRALLGE